MERKDLRSWNHLSVEMNPGPGFEEVYDFFLSLPLKTSRAQDLAREANQCRGFLTLASIS